MSNCVNLFLFKHRIARFLASVEAKKLILCKIMKL